MFIRFNSNELRVPDFLVVGAARCGTTTLYSYLARHPRIFMPAEKEPEFFCAWNGGSFYELYGNENKVETEHIVSDLAVYSGLYSQASGWQILGEASTWYLYDHRRVISNIQKLYGERAREVKIIIFLRDPAERAWSHYWVKRVNGVEHLDFDMAISPEIIGHRLKHGGVLSYDYSGFSRYSEAVRSYLEAFSQARIYFFEDLKEKPEALLRDVLNFLGVEETGKAAEYSKPRRLNPAGVPKNVLAAVVDRLLFKPNRLRSRLRFLLPFSFRRKVRPVAAGKIFRKVPLPAEERRALVEYFREDISKLEKLLGKDLAHWKK